MAKKDIKKMIQEIIDKNPPRESFTKVAARALQKEKYERVFIFDYYSASVGRQQLVMVNMNAPDKELESGCLFDEKGEINGFYMSRDTRSVSVDSNTRFLVLDSIVDETVQLRLKALAKNDCTWIVHCVHDKDGSVYPVNFCNYHTHGMRPYTHKDFQIILDLGDRVAEYILNALCSKVRDGEILMSGQVIGGGIYNNLPIKLCPAKEAGRNVLRVLIPDDNGLFPGDRGCAAPFCDQMRDIRDA